MKFVNPWMLVLVALVPLAGVFWIWLRARAERRLGGLVAPSLRARLLPGQTKLFGLQAALLLAGLFLVVFAAARPQWGHSAQKVRAKSRNVVVALDVSRSMLAADVRPNRLERAKADLGDLIDALDGDRCALVAFRRTGVLLCPLTKDHAFLRSALEGLGPESAPRGETDLGGGIRTALEALDPAADDHNAIILISDGGDLRGGVIEAARRAAKRNVPIFTVGLGDPKAGCPIPDPSGTGNLTYKGEVVTTKLEEEALMKIAKESGGRYLPLATTGMAETTLGAIYRRFIRQVAAKEQAEEEELRATERFDWFLIPGLVLLLAAAMFSRGRFVGRVMRPATVLCLLAGLSLRAETASSSAPLAPASTNVAAVAVASTNAVSTDAASAATDPLYRPPAETQLSDRERWNRAYDFWQAGDTTNALPALQALVTSRTHGARACELIAAIQQRTRMAALQQYQQANDLHAEGAALSPLRAADKAGEDALEATQRVLREQPEDARAARNFTRAVAGMKELRETLHREEVLARMKGRKPEEILDEARKEALAVLRAESCLHTNAAAETIRQGEALAVRARGLADRLIPVKRHVFESVTNEQQRAVIVGCVDSTYDAATEAADLLEDLSPDAADRLGKVETDFHRYWKESLEPPAALREELAAQTNACLGAAAENGRDWQQEAVDFAAVFGVRGKDWLQQACAQDAATASNAVPYTAQLGAEVAEQVAALAKRQSEQLKKPDEAARKEILAELTQAAGRFGLLGLDPRQLIGEDLQAQSNAFMDVERADGGDWQKDALERTRVFRAKFPSWARQKEQEIQKRIQGGDTNAVPFTQEIQAKIAGLAASVEPVQAALCKEALPPEQQKVHGVLRQIEELLPKDPGNQPPPQQDNQNQQNQQNQPQNQPQQNQQDNQDQQQEQQQQQDQQQDQQQQDIEDMQRRVQERNDEHDKRKRENARGPRGGFDRDW